MLTIKNLSYSYPQKDLYNKVSFTLEDKQHCALIGTSGTGKSTLIDLILHPDDHIFDGKIIVEPNCRFGYVSQFTQFDEDTTQTVFDYLSEEFVERSNEIATLCEEMATSDDLDSVFEKYQQVLDQFQAMDGDNYESNIQKTLGIAGLDKYATYPVSKLSGGEFKLIQVMREMLVTPDILIMDEPDVFLDFEHVNALKDLINSYKGIMLVITHNRYLLNHCFNKILHLENTEIQEFDGNYVDYNYSLLDKKIELMELAYADQLEIERNQALVNKLRKEATIFTSASRGRALNARVSLLKRLEAKAIKEPFVHIKQPAIEFSTDNVLEDVAALKVSDYSLAFDHTLLEHVDFEIMATDKVALIGGNGSGKTSLLKDIFRNQSSSIEINPDVTIGYLSQLQGETINEKNSIYNEFLENGFDTYQEVEEYLARYCVDDEILNQKIGTLSGGEKNILQLAKIGASNANFLLLDEPTSHLDIYAQIALEKAINDYNGGILMVSHDFYTIANCMDYVLLIEDKTVRKMSIRKFRKMIYANHFSLEYLELEQKKKEVETRIAFALQNKDFELAKVLMDDLAVLIEKMR